MSREKIGFVDGLVAAAKDNPAAAVLIGGGALWLLTGNEKMKSAARSMTSAVSLATDLGARAAQSAASVLESSPPTAPELDDEGSHIGETVRRAAGVASDAMSKTANRVKAGLDGGVAYVQENLGKMADPLPGKQAYEKAQSSLASALERQPLLLGAVGLAIGAAIAGAFRISDLENEVVGKFSDEVKSDLNARTDAVARSVREASDTLKAEFSDVGAEALDLAKQTGLDAAVDAAREASKA
jgi:hypothetical protein